MILCFLSYLHPIILFPPSGGTNLFTTYNTSELPFYCPKFLNDSLVYLTLKSVVLPYANCALRLLSLGYTDQVISKYPIYYKDFGGFDSIKSVLYAFGNGFIDSLGVLVDRLVESGYKIKQDLFGAPYDWRFAPLFSNFTEIQQLIEHAYQINNQQKVILLGFSCGGWMIQHFLTEKVSPEWKLKYIDRVIFLAPSFAGSFVTFLRIWTGKYPRLGHLQKTEIRSFLGSLSTYYQHFYNFEIFKGIPIIREKNREYEASQLPEFLLSSGKLSKEQIQIMNRSIEINKKIPASVDVPSFVIYNSGMQTEFGFHFVKDIQSTPKIIYKEGDEIVPSYGIKWICDNWPADKHPLICYDLDQNHKSFSHSGLTSNPFVTDLIINLTRNGTWTQEKGRKFLRAPFIETYSKSHKYRIRDDIRRGKVINEL